MMGSGWDLFQLAYRNSISRSLPLQDFFRVQVRCFIYLFIYLFFFLGGGGAESSTAAILTMALATI